MPGTCQEPGHQVMAPYTSATSLAFQAFWPVPLRQAYLRGYPFEEYATAHWDSPEQLENFLAQARRKGAILLGGPGDKPFRVAVPVFSCGHELLAILGLALPAGAAPGDDPQRQSVVRAMADGADALGRARDSQTKETLTC
jgi:DNA-binding IclR family transcriptional regulator